MNIMMKSAVALLSLALAPAAMAACDYPAKPSELPDGASATKEEMLAGVKQINEFQTAMSEYLACIEADQVVAVQALDEDDSEGRARSEEIFNQKYNTAVEEQTRVVEQFNIEIRAYKARSN